MGVPEECEDFIRSYKRYLDCKITSLRTGREEICKKPDKAPERCKRLIFTLKILGTYECTNKKITLYLGCLLDEVCPSKDILVSEVLETLAHELIHHAQGNNISKLGSVKIEVRGDCNIFNTYSNLPYFYRPYEVEAFDKQKTLAKELEMDKNVENAVAQLIDAFCNNFKDFCLGDL